MMVEDGFNDQQIKRSRFSGSFLRRWPEEKWLAFISFCKHFISASGKHWSVTPRNQETAEQSSDPDWIEFVTIVRATRKNQKKFSTKLVTFRNAVFDFLQKHPECVTDRMRDETAGYPIFDLAIRRPIFERIPKEVEVLPAAGNPSDHSYQEALKKSLTLFHKVADTISNKEILEMAPSKKIEALRNLNQIFISAKANAPRSLVFQNFNIESAGVEDLEKALMDYNEEQEEAS